MIYAMLSTLKAVALCVAIDRQSGPYNKVTLQVPLELRFHLYDT